MGQKLLQTQENMLFWITILFAAEVLSQGSPRRNLLEACSNDGDCPQDSKCTIRGCDGSICLCRGNKIPNLNYTKCVSFAEIGEKCTSSRVCRPVSSRCDHVMGACACQNGYSPSSSNNNVVYCKQKPLLSTSTSFSLLNEQCNDLRLKCSPENHLQCVKGVCVCSSGYKEASMEIINAYPFNVVQCVPVNFSIGIKIEKDQCFSPVTPRPPPEQTSNAIPMSTTDQFSSNLVSTSDIPSLSTDFGQTMPSASLPSFTNLQPTPTITPSTYETQKYSSGVPEALTTTRFEESSSNLFSSTLLPSSNAPGLVSETNLETLQTLSYTSVNSVYTTFISEMMTSNEVYTPSSSNDFSSSSSIYTSFITSSVVEFSSISLEPSLQQSSTPISSPYVMLSSSEISSSSIASSSAVNVNSASSSNFLKTTSTRTPSSAFSSKLSSTISSIEETVTFSPSSVIEIPQTSTLTILPTPSQSSGQSVASSLVVTSISASTVPSTAPSTVPSTTIKTPVETTGISTTQTTTETENTTTKTTSTTTATKTTTESVVETTESSTTSTTTSSTTTPTTVTTKPTTKPTTLPKSQTTPNVIPVGERCEAESVCPDHAVCETRSRCGGDLVCFCRDGYTPSDNNEKCLKIQYLGGKCSSDRQCLGPNTGCVDGVCACREDFLSSNNNMRCRREMSWFVSFPLLEDRCSGFLSSCYNYDEQECRNKVCVCKEGYRELLDAERKLRHKGFQQCVKNDTNHDVFNETARCTDITASDFSDPYYSEGKRKIRVMQGAIIGGIMAFLVLVLIATGIILYIRYKKRTGDMNNDSGSEISFERQSSGRYSFKIPRPFATYDTTPADNISFHNRSFKEDETHRLREDELKSLNGTLAKFYFDDIDYKPQEDFKPLENGK